MLGLVTFAPPSQRTLRPRAAGLGMVALVFALYGAPREAAAAPGVEPASPDDVDGLSAEEISAADLSGTWQTFHIPGAVLSVAPADPRPRPPAPPAPAGRGRGRGHQAQEHSDHHWHH